MVASQQPGKVGRAYLYGLTNGPFLGWVLGTLLGALAGGLLPAAVTEALGIAIYGMFIAIVLPPFRRSREVRAVVLVAVGLSCLISLWPVLSFISRRLPHHPLRGGGLGAGRLADAPPL